MSSHAPKPKVIAIVGPTASGKSALAVELAQTLGGEVISVDSRQVYRGLDIGTGKVTREEMHGIPHHLLNVADPATDTYTAADFVRDATAAINTIHARGKTPILCGGTFFYLDSLRGRTQPAPVPPNPTLRAELETLPKEQLTERLHLLDPHRAAAIDTNNPRRLIRAIEVATALGAVPALSAIDSPWEWLTLGISVPPATLRERIAQRLDERLATGMVEEVIHLRESGVSDERLIAFGLEYRHITEHLRGTLSADEMRMKLYHAICQYAKRQRSWLRRDATITWLPYPVDRGQAVAHADHFLSR